MKHILFLISVLTLTLLIVHAEFYGDVWKSISHFLFIAVLIFISTLAYIAGYVVGTNTTIESESNKVYLIHKGGKTIVKANSLTKVEGKWPGEESEEYILKTLKEGK